MNNSAHWIRQPISRRPALPRVDRRAKHAGFSLMEVLVSVVVLSFGLLGVVGMQTSALKFTRDAQLQSVAVGYARELAEMMRANAQVAGTASNPYLGDFSGSVPLAPNSPSSCLNVGSTCSSATDVARAEMTSWLARISADPPTELATFTETAKKQTSLPGARVKVCYDDRPYDNSGLPVWDCTTPASASLAVTYIKIGWTREDFQGKIVASDSGDARPFVVIPIVPSGQQS